MKSLKKFTIYSFIVWIFVSVVTVLLYGKVWAKESLSVQYVVLVISFFIGIIIHEFIHGFFFARYNSKGWSSVKFGVLKYLSAFYCHCPEPITAKHAKIAVIAPVIVTGFIPYIIFFILGNYTLVYASTFLIAGGTADIIIYMRLRKLPPNTLVLDTLDEVGFIVAGDKKEDPEGGEF